MANDGRDITWLNQATVEDLEDIEGIGRKRAEEIIKDRDQNGEFKKWDDLKRIPGFSQEMINVLRSQGGDGGPGGER